jgi:hypothetical protein
VLEKLPKESGNCCLTPVGFLLFTFVLTAEVNNIEDVVEGHNYMQHGNKVV